MLDRRWQVCFGFVLLALVVSAPVSGASAASPAPPALGSCPAASSAPLVLAPSSHWDFIKRSAWVFYDSAGTLGYDDIVKADRAGRFVHHCRADFAPPAAGGALWIRLDVERPTDAAEDWAIVFGEHEIDEARLYQQLPKGLFVLKRTGRAVSPSVRDVVSRWPAFEMSLEPDTPTRLYLRLSGIGAPYISAQVMPLKEHIDQNGRDLLTLAAVLGFLVAMLAYNLVIYVRSRLHHCLFYFLYLGFIIANIVVYDGLIYRFAGFTLSGHFADSLAQEAGAGAAVSLLMFGRALLGLSKTAPKVDIAVLGIAAAIIAAVLLEAAGVLPHLIVSNVLMIGSGVLMCGCAAYFALRGFRPAVYFTFSYFALLMGVVLDTIGYYFPVSLGPGHPILSILVGLQQNWSFHLGVCAETVLISFAITYFIRDMQADIAGARVKTQALTAAYEEKIAALASKVGIRERVKEKTAAMFTAQSGDEGFLDNAVRVVLENIADEAFDVARLAKELAVSDRTLRRRLARIIGQSPVEFVRRQRLEQGHRHLQSGTFQTVAEVARAVGFANPGYFARHYRAAFGQTPADVLRGMSGGAVRN